METESLLKFGAGKKLTVEGSSDNDSQSLELIPGQSIGVPVSEEEREAIIREQNFYRITFGEEKTAEEIRELLEKRRREQEQQQEQYDEYYSQGMGY